MSDRTKLSLENEIINFFSHTVDTQNEQQTLKRIPSLVKRILKELSVIDYARGQLFILKQNERSIPDSVKEIRDLEKFIEEKEKELISRYRHEEIKGT